MTRMPFIVFDGPDGSGKSSQLRRAAAALKAEGVPLITTREPGGSVSAEKIRSLVLSGEPDDFCARSETLLFTAARVEHLRTVVRPHMERGSVVLCDRYVSSTLAYQVGGGGVPVDDVLTLHRLFCDDFWPDLTVVIDVPAEVGLARSKARLADAAVDEGRFEDKEVEYHRRLRKAFLDLAASRPGFVVIDGTRSMDEVFDDVMPTVRRAIAGCASR